jgi:TonB family protein
MRPRKSPNSSRLELILSHGVLLIALAAASASVTAADDPAAAQAPPPLVAANRTEPKPTFTPRPSYPLYAADKWSEGWVTLNFTVTKQGTVKDLVAVDGMGTPDFFSSAIRTVQRWKFKPGTEGGQKVDTPNFMVNVLYTNDLFPISRSLQNDRHEIFITKFQQSQQLAQNGRRQEAITILESSLTTDRLTHRELSSASFLLAKLYVPQDNRRALFHLRHSMFIGREILKLTVLPDVLQLQVVLEAANGHLRDALMAFEPLKRINPRFVNEEVIKTVERINEALANPMPFSFEARLEPSLTGSELAVWHHRLSRPTFSFADIKGRLDRFRLACLRQAVEAEANDKLQWTVNQGWGDCTLFVFGASGTTFEFIESR